MSCREISGSARMRGEVRLRPVANRGGRRKKRPPYRGDLRDQRISANPSAALLCLFFGCGCRFGRELKYCRFLTVSQHSQQDDAAVRKFERVMMSMRLILV